MATYIFPSATFATSPNSAAGVPKLATTSASPFFYFPSGAPGRLIDGGVWWNPSPFAAANPLYLPSQGSSAPFPMFSHVAAVPSQHHHHHQQHHHHHGSSRGTKNATKTTTTTTKKSAVADATKTDNNINNSSNNNKSKSQNNAAALSNMNLNSPTNPAFAVFGLGNPRSDGQRHNTGSACVKAILEKYPSKRPLLAGKCGCFEVFIEGNRVYLCFPKTYMNDSGKAVRAFTRDMAIEAERTIVIHDDIDLPLGAVRIRNKGSSGGQNGMEDILNRMPDGDDCPLIRIKVGVGKPSKESKIDVGDYLLSSFTTQEAETLKPTIAKVVETVAVIVKGMPFEKVVSQYNYAGPQAEAERVQKQANKALAKQKKQQQAAAAAAAAQQQQQQQQIQQQQSPPQQSRSPVPFQSRETSSPSPVRMLASSPTNKNSAPIRTSPPLISPNVAAVMSLPITANSKLYSSLDPELEIKFASTGMRAAAVEAADVEINQRRRQSLLDSKNNELSPELMNAFQKRKDKMKVGKK